MSNVPAGWYPEQPGSERMRYWNGTAWADMSELTKESERPRRGIGCLGVLGIILAPMVVFGVVFWLIFGVWAASTGPSDRTHLQQAEVACERAVNNALTAPTTAIYNSEATGSGPWTVVGTVDSENAFGAMVRSDYRCTVELEGDRMIATLDELG